VFKINRTDVLAIEVGAERGKRWRPVIAVSQDPAAGWPQTGVDAVLQTRRAGLYRDDPMFHVGTPAFSEIGGRGYLSAQACPRPANGNDIDGHWDLWCIACDCLTPTRPGSESSLIPGLPASPVPVARSPRPRE
jgi:hypothetical protein